MVVASGAYLWSKWPDVPDREQLSQPDWSLASVVYTAEGQELARFQQENRTWVPYGQISPHAVSALLATEDHRFFSHDGIDFFRLGSSAVQTLLGDRQGGSTVTMQLARNLFPGFQTAPPFERKLKELITALRLEQQYGKPEILEMYLNTVSYGNRAFGIQEAARTYFGKSAASLSLTESALLIGLLKGPSWYNPLRHPERALNRRNIVLDVMLRRGYLEEAEHTRLRNEPLGLDFQSLATVSSLAPHFVEHVRTWVEAWAEANGHDVYSGGLRIYTTLDSRLQNLAQEAVGEQMQQLQAVANYEWSHPQDFFLSSNPAAYPHMAGQPRFSYFWQTHPEVADAYVRGSRRYKTAVVGGTHPEAAFLNLRLNATFMDSLSAVAGRLETGFIAIEPATGHVKAWIGGRDFGQDQYDKVALARRQPGSTFKPFVFAAAVDYGYAPDQLVSESPQGFRTVSADTGAAKADALTVRHALAISSNTATAHFVDVLGPRRVASYAQRLGIKSELRAVSSLGLGTSEVTLLEMASAYGTLANQGMHREPVVVTRIEDHSGRVLARFEPPAERAISAYTAYAVVDMLRDAVGYGTAREIRTRFGIRADVAGKTGTTQHNADGWFMLMHPELVAGSWVGFNDPRVTFRSDHWGQGAHNALYVVGAFFQRLTADQLLTRNVRFALPPGYTHTGKPEAVSEEIVLATDGSRAPLVPSADLQDSTGKSLSTLPADADVEQALRLHVSGSQSSE
jgi:penicillin-binding protein 1A